MERVGPTHAQRANVAAGPQRPVERTPGLGAGGVWSAPDILALQRSVGNQAVQRLMPGPGWPPIQRVVAVNTTDPPEYLGKGGFTWSVEFDPGAPAPHGGWVVQEVQTVVSDDEPDSHYWEAFRVGPGRDRTNDEDTYTMAPTHDDDGERAATGNAEFHADAAAGGAGVPPAPAGMVYSGPDDPAGGLPWSQAAPPFWQGGGTAHNLSVEWERGVEPTLATTPAAVWSMTNQARARDGLAPAVEEDGGEGDGEPVAEVAAEAVAEAPGAEGGPGGAVVEAGPALRVLDSRQQVADWVHEYFADKPEARAAFRDKAVADIGDLDALRAWLEAAPYHVRLTDTAVGEGGLGYLV